MRIALSTAVWLGVQLALAASAHAGNDVGVVVAGESWMQPQLVAQIESWLSQHGHTFVQSPLPPDALAALNQCFTNSDESCARSVVEKSASSTSVIYARLDAKSVPAGPPDVTVTAYLLDKGRDAIGSRQTCLRCTDQTLRTTADAILKKLVGGGDLGHLKLKSAPPGARISIDGQPIGVAPLDWDLLPGKHTILMDSPGRKPVTQERIVESNKSDLVVMTLTADGTGEPDEESDGGLPRWVPWTAVGVGGAAVIAGVGLIVFSPGPDKTQRYYTNTKPPGFGLTIGGALVGGFGAYWLLSRSPKAASTPVASFSSDSAYVGWLGSF